MAATMIDNDNNIPSYTRAAAAIDSLSPEDFETASIRSAAPSYTSDAPSYHTLNPHPDPSPPYSPPPPSSTTATTIPRSSNHLPPLLPPPNSSSPARGLPPVPTGPIPSPSLSLSQFRIPSWSPSNPQARHYHNVALRRASSSSSSSLSSSSANASQETLRRVMLERIEEEESRRRIRPLEDPYLVGEEAASRARQERLARENGDDILIRENRRWDWFLRQMKEREEREERIRRLGNGGERNGGEGAGQRGFGIIGRGGRLAFRVGGRS
ncbi:hypothetical protein QBC36DRAFT_366086 [Triangularia setosa]|uniref:Uncharacterized protein n=1 Tax=Triangularia setosa TaxID=2587417 RepID=A0AAN7A865_9PEZI|nr:hypothetical protein QBC36DRAFT_366086 [Podospora setosa]